MKRSNLNKIVFAIVLCTLCSTAYAQTSDAAGEVWKKKVARIIDIAPKHDSLKHPSKTKQDSSLTEIIVTAAKAGKLIAFSNVDNEFTTKLSVQDIKKITGPKVDTITLTDPVTNSEIVKVVSRDFDFTAIHKYRILEEWTFDQRTGKTQIQITGIAPLREIFGDDGTFRGVQALFWLRYNDAYPIISRYEKKQPENTISSHIWRDYFSNTDLADNVWKAKAGRVINMTVKDDNASHHLMDLKQDETMYDMIVNEIKKGALPAYALSDDALRSKISFDSLRSLIGIQEDTITLTDPTTNTELEKIISRDLIYSRISAYTLIEEWAFDPHTGKTDIQIRSIGPSKVEKDNTGTIAAGLLLFWVRYNDAHVMISRYEQYHPDNTLASHIWADYFLSDVKPELQK